MVTLTLDEVRERLSELVEAASRGETVTIVKNGTPVAELGPARPDTSIDQVAVDEALGDLDRLQDDPARPRVTVEDLLSWRDEGRA